MSHLPFIPVTTSNVDAWIRQAATTVNLLIQALDTVPSGSATTGEIKLWPTSTAPTGWLSCNGAAVSRTTYDTLYALVGTAFGVGDGTTTFNVPDMRGRFVRGLPAAGTVGATGGASTVTLTQANLPSVNFTVTDPGHTHTFTGTSHAHTITDAGHTHTFTGASHAHTVTDAGHTHIFTGDSHTHSVTDPGHTHPASTGNFVLGADGSGAALGTLTASGAAEAVGIDSIQGMSPTTGSGTTGISLASATQTGTNATATTGITLASATQGGTNATVATGISLASATADGTIASVATSITVASGGSGTAITITPPYIDMHYIIKT